MQNINYLPGNTPYQGKKITNKIYCMQLNNHPVVTPDIAPVELDLSAFLYEAIDASDFIDIKNWMSSFDAIPVDP